MIISLASMPAGEYPFSRGRNRYFIRAIAFSEGITIPYWMGMRARVTIRVPSGMRTFASKVVPSEAAIVGGGVSSGMGIFPLLLAVLHWGLGLFGVLDGRGRLLSGLDRLGRDDFSEGLLGTAAVLRVACVVLEGPLEITELQVGLEELLGEVRHSQPNLGQGGVLGPLVGGVLDRLGNLHLQVVLETGRDFHPPGGSHTGVFLGRFIKLLVLPLCVSVIDHN